MAPPAASSGTESPSNGSSGPATGCRSEREIDEMKSPYVVAHVLSSIHRRIQVHTWPPLSTSSIFESTAETFKSDAWVVGRTTMQEFSSKKPHRLGNSDSSIPEEDFVGEHSAKTYAVAIDPSGKCRWDSNRVSTEHVIEVLSESVSN